MRVVLVWLAALSIPTMVMMAPLEATAHPRMSATSGAPCTTCHYNSDGGGMRTEIGWDIQKHTGLIEHDRTRISLLDNRTTNRVVDWMAVGADVRAMRVRATDGPPPTVGDDGDLVLNLPSQRIFPMQAQPYVWIDPIDQISLYGSYAISDQLFDGELCAVTYSGQACGQAYMKASFSPRLPSLQAGVFRPSTGIRHDDHTMVTYLQDPSFGLSTVQPPNYAEFGVQASYQPRYWIKVEAGGYRSDQLASAIDDNLMGTTVVEGSDPAYLGRVTYYPRFDFGPERSFFGWVGASVYGAGDYRNDQGFVGMGWLDRGAVMMEVSHLDFGSDAQRRTINASTTGAVQVSEWFVPHVRVEQSIARGDNSDEDRRRAATAGFQFYPVPFVKIQPEYRLVQYHNPGDERAGWSMGQYYVQLHLFY